MYAHSQYALGNGASKLNSLAASVPDRQDIVSIYGIQAKPSVPDPAGAAIQLVFAFEETGISLQIPPHLPETRALANASFRTGPTKEDFLALASYRTPLHSDSLFLSGAEHPCVAPHREVERSARHDVQFRDVFNILRHPRGSAMCIPTPPTPIPCQYIPGSMTGLWEGTTKVNISWAPQILRMTIP